MDKAKTNEPGFMDAESLQPMAEILKMLFYNKIYCATRLENLYARKFIAFGLVYTTFGTKYWPICLHSTHSCKLPKLPVNIMNSHGSHSQ